jgi:hypothetical protein
MRIGHIGGHYFEIEFEAIQTKKRIAAKRWLLIWMSEFCMVQWQAIESLCLIWIVRLQRTLGVDISFQCHCGSKLSGIAWEGMKVSHISVNRLNITETRTIEYEGRWNIIISKTGRCTCLHHRYAQHCRVYGMVAEPALANRFFSTNFHARRNLKLLPCPPTHTHTYTHTHTSWT